MLKIFCFLRMVQVRLVDNSIASNAMFHNPTASLRLLLHGVVRPNIAVKITRKVRQFFGQKSVIYASL
jgi:hypothetical protein